MSAGATLNRGRLIGGVDRVLDRMRDRLTEVADLAVALGLPEAAAWAKAAERAAGERLERMLISLLQMPPGA